MKRGTLLIANEPLLKPTMETPVVAGTIIEMSTNMIPAQETARSWVRLEILPLIIGG